MATEMNFTISVPEGTKNHGNPNLLCPPTQWHDFIIFFFGNYFAHAATVVPVPGQSLRSCVVYIFLALALPGSAVMRAFTAIVQRAATAPDPLTRAARAGALCMVVKTKDPPGVPEVGLQSGAADVEKGPPQSDVSPSGEGRNASSDAPSDELKIPLVTDPDGQRAPGSHSVNVESRCVKRFPARPSRVITGPTCSSTYHAQG